MRNLVATTCALGLLAAGALPALAFHQEDDPEEARNALTETILRADFSLDEETAISSYIQELSDGQVAALNRSLHNTQNGWVPEITSEDLKLIVDHEYNQQQISALTKAREEFAKFTELGMDDKANAQLERFSAKAERLGDPDPILEPAEIESAADLATQEAKRLAKDAAKDAASKAARGAALQAVKLEARANAKRLVKQETRDRHKTGKALGKNKQ